MTNTKHSSTTTPTTSSSFNLAARPTSSSNSYPVSHFRKLHTEFTHQVHKLTYDIDSWSSHSALYHPRHIMVNKPLEQGSRWSSNSNNQMQFITLKLDKMAIVRILLCAMRQCQLPDEHNNSFIRDLR